MVPGTRFCYAFSITEDVGLYWKCSSVLLCVSFSLETLILFVNCTVVYFYEIHFVTFGNSVPLGPPKRLSSYVLVQGSDCFKSLRTHDLRPVAQHAFGGL